MAKAETIGHNVLAAAFLVLVSVLEGRPFSIRPTLLDPLVWAVVVEGWTFKVMFELGEPIHVESIAGPNVKGHHFEIDFAAHDPSWEHIFANVVRIDDLANRITGLCRLHPEWKYGEKK